MDPNHESANLAASACAADADEDAVLVLSLLGFPLPLLIRSGRISMSHFLRLAPLLVVPAEGATAEGPAENDFAAPGTPRRETAFPPPRPLSTSILYDFLHLVTSRWVVLYMGDDSIRRLATT